MPGTSSRACHRPFFRGAGGLGQTVAFEHRDARAAEEMAEPLAERRAAADRVPQSSANCSAQPPVDKPVEQRVPQPQFPASAAAGHRAFTGCAPLDRRLFGGSENSGPRWASRRLCRAALWTFSNTLGTASRNVGRNSASPPGSVAVSGQCPRIAPASSTPTWMMRAKRREPAAWPTSGYFGPSVPGCGRASARSFGRERSD